MSLRECLAQISLSLSFSLVSLQLVLVVAKIATSRPVSLKINLLSSPFSVVSEGIRVMDLNQISCFPTVKHFCA